MIYIVILITGISVTRLMVLFLRDNRNRNDICYYVIGVYTVCSLIEERVVRGKFYRIFHRDNDKRRESLLLPSMNIIYICSLLNNLGNKRKRQKNMTTASFNVSLAC